MVTKAIEDAMMESSEWIYYRKVMIECGRHSNIPECCVAFFICVWQPAYCAYTVESYEWLAWRRTQMRLWNYVPCDQCLKEKRVIELAKCPDECVMFGRGKLVSDGH